MKQCGLCAVMCRALRVVRINTCPTSASMPAQSSRTLPVRQSITLPCQAARRDLLLSRHTSLAQFISIGTSFFRYFIVGPLCHFYVLFQCGFSNDPRYISQPALLDVASLMIKSKPHNPSQPSHPTTSTLVCIFRKRCPRECRFLYHRRDLKPRDASSSLNPPPPR